MCRNPRKTISIDIEGGLFWIHDKLQIKRTKIPTRQKSWLSTCRLENLAYEKIAKSRLLPSDFWGPDSAMIPNSQIQTHWDSSNRNLCRIRTADWEMKPLIITKNSLLLHKMVSFVDSDALFLLSVPRWIMMLPTTGESSCSCLCSLKCIPVNYYYLPEKKEKKRSVDGDRWSRHIAEKLKKQSTATHIYSFTGVGSLLIHHYCWFTSCLDCH